MKNCLYEVNFKFELVDITKPCLGQGRHSIFSSLRTVFTFVMKIQNCVCYIERKRCKLDLQLFCGCSFKRNIGS